MFIILDLMINDVKFMFMWFHALVLDDLFFECWFGVAGMVSRLMISDL